MFNGKLIKSNKKYKLESNVVIGGADLSDLPNKEKLIQSHIHEAQELAHQEAQIILDQAKREAAQLVEDATKDSDDIKIQSYQEGFEVGKAEAQKLISEEFEDVLTNAAKVLTSLEQERKECLEDEEARIYKAMVLMAKQITKKDLSLNPEVSMEFIREALKKIETKTQIKIQVDAQTAASLNSAKEKILELNPDLENLTIQSNPDLEIGDMILESGTERLDLRLEAQFEELAKEILK